MMTNTTQQFLRVSFLVLFAMLLAACGGGDGVAEESSGEISDIPGEVPQQYRELVNPLEGDAEVLARGTEAYQALCIQCHGVQGRGEGEEAAGFNPPPGDLSSSRTSESSDGYLYWRIADGGNFAPFNSLMPAWGTLLSEIEIWELVTYLRTLSG